MKAATGSSFMRGWKNKKLKSLLIGERKAAVLLIERHRR